MIRSVPVYNTDGTSVSLVATLEVQDDDSLVLVPEVIGHHNSNPLNQLLIPAEDETPIKSVVLFLCYEDGTPPATAPAPVPGA